jgi:ankyrin repeat protein
LHESIRLNIGEAIWEYLVSAGIDVNAKNNDGETPLHTAARCYYFNDEAIRWLVAKGADVHVKDNFGKTALENAMESLNDDMNMHSRLTRIQMNLDPSFTQRLHEAIDLQERAMG